MGEFKAALKTGGQPAYGLHYNLGRTYDQARKPIQALKHYKLAIKANPGFREGHLKAAAVYRDQGKPDKVVEHLSAAIELDPTDHNAYGYLAGVLNNMKRWSQAAEYYEKGLALEPRDVTNHVSLADTLTNIKRYSEAAEHYSAALAVEPLNGEALSGALHVGAATASWANRLNHLAALRPSLSAELSAGKPSSLSPYRALFLPIPPVLRRRIGASWAAMYGQQASAQPVPPFEPPPLGRGRKPSIGFISRRIEDYAGTHLMLPVYGALNGSTNIAAVHVFARGPDDGSAERAAVASAVAGGPGGFSDLSLAPTAAAAQAVRAAGVDVLVDYDGFHDFSNAELLAIRGARLQCGWIGFPGSSGSNFVDCIIADRVVAPPELARYETFNEKLLYMPHSFTAAGYAGHQPIANVGRAAAGLPPAGLARFVLCSFNRLEKLDPTTFRLWVTMALRVRGGVLWLLETDGPGSTARANLQAEAAALGLAEDRLLFAGRVPKDQHLGRMGLADMFVDSAHYSAHTIAADALWAGLPLLACPTDTYSSRVSASMLAGAGLPDIPLPVATAAAPLAASGGADRRRPARRSPLIAASWKEYSDAAAAIAEAKATLQAAAVGESSAEGGVLAAEVRATSREIGTLFDNDALVRGLEDTLLAALDGQREG